MSEELDETLADAITAETVIAAPPRSERARFLRFLVTGGLAAGVNIVSRILFDRAVVYEIAVVLAYLVGMTTAFILARLFVFDGRAGDARGQYMRFALVNVLAFAQVWIVSVGLDRYIFPAIGWTWQAATLAHAIGVVSPVAASYFGHRKFSFRS
jgi:putative flippase GtrA